MESGKSDKESLVEAAAKEEEEEEEEEEEHEEEEDEFHHQGERGKGKKELKKTKSSLRFGCIPKKPPKEKGFHEVPKYVAPRDDIVRSGHENYQTLYATNDVTTGDFTVNRLGAPNDSTVMCGCENTSCPFCNIVLSIRNRDPAMDAEGI